jgi:NFU1 iron-sulfur cluster scaffold homolog, mitochondrial
VSEEIPYEVYCEETPNPASLKFVANKLLVVSGANAEYTSPSETDDAPLARELFRFPFVKRLFFSSNFISITKSEQVEWIEIRDELRVFITKYLNAGKPVILKLPTRKVPKDTAFRESIEVQTQHAAPANEVEARVIEVLEQYIRPAVEQDGGLITFKELKDGVLTVQMRGSCSGCPSSTLTLKAGIEALLKRLLPDQISEVVSEAV